MTTKPRVYTVKETAELLRISLPTAYESIERGELPSVRVGRRVLVPAGQLERLLSGENEATN